MTSIFYKFHDISVLLFIVSAALHVLIIILNIKEIRGEQGNHIQIAIRQYKTGGVKGKLFAISLFIIVFCFLFWTIAALTK